MSNVRKVPMRKCVGCGEMKSKKEMMRVLKTVDEEFVLDATGKKNGRGAYLCRKSECLKLARKSRRIDRALETQIPDAIYDRLEEEFNADEA